MTHENEIIRNKVLPFLKTQLNDNLTVEYFQLRDTQICNFIIDKTNYCPLFNKIKKVIDIAIADEHYNYRNESNSVFSENIMTSIKGKTRTENMSFIIEMNNDDKEDENIAYIDICDRHFKNHKLPLTGIIHKFEFNCTYTKNLDTGIETQKISPNVIFMDFTLVDDTEDGYETDAEENDED
jgi:hypothetical protein